MKLLPPTTAPSSVIGYKVREIARPRRQLAETKCHLWLIPQFVMIKDGWKAGNLIPNFGGSDFSTFCLETIPKQVTEFCGSLSILPSH